MVLSDRTIREEMAKGEIVIEPFESADLQPASVDLHLAQDLRVFVNHTEGFVDLNSEQPELTKVATIPSKRPFILHPGEFVLGNTLERIELGNRIVARLEGKSSLGRIGLLIHSTAGFVDPGWQGTLTLELSNVSRLPLTLYRGMPIGQISFQYLTTDADRPYGSAGLRSRYQHQQGPTATRIHEGFSDTVRGE